MFNYHKTAFKVIIVFFRILNLIPLKWGRKIGIFIGMIWYRIDRNHRNIVTDNLLQSFPGEKTVSEINTLSRRVFENLSMILFEIAWSMNLDEKKIDRYFEIRGLSNLLSASDKQKGVLVLAGHLGNWELVPAFIAMKTRLQAGIVYRPLDFKPLDEFFKYLRGRYGANMIPAKRAMRKIFSGLKNRGIVGILLDQNVDWYDGCFVDFFGRSAFTNKWFATIALKTGAPVIPVMLVRTGSGFMVEFGKEIPLIKTGDQTKDIEKNTAYYNHVLETFIRRYPEQWLWAHRRWKTKAYHPWPRK
ncbi:MAG: lysophospholipid acyltransferase family protein [Desulfobacterales bacterium]|nr:lysophospholipid acyltransferase family protein [Desulfobacterales bacterium]